MKLSRKEFKIVQLIDDKEDFVINEILYVLGISWSYCWHSLDGLNGEIPFNYLNSAEEKLQELEQLEEIECEFRDGGIMLFLIIFAIMCFSIYNTVRS